MATRRPLHSCCLRACHLLPSPPLNPHLTSQRSSSSKFFPKFPLVHQTRGFTASICPVCFNFLTQTLQSFRGQQSWIWPHCPFYRPREKGALSQACLPILLTVDLRTARTLHSEEEEGRPTPTPQSNRLQARSSGAIRKRKEVFMMLGDPRGPWLHSPPVIGSQAQTEL